AVVLFRLFLDGGNQLFHGLDIQRWRYDQDVRHVGHQRKGDQIGLRVVAELRVQRWVDRYRPDGIDKQGVAIRLGIDGDTGADIAARAGAVLHDHALAPLLCQAVADFTSQDVGGAARRERHDDRDGLCRPVGGVDALADAGSQGKQPGGQGRQDGFFRGEGCHFKSPDNAYVVEFLCLASFFQSNDAIHCDDLIGLYEQGVDLCFGYGLPGHAGKARDIDNGPGQAVDIPAGKAAKAAYELAVLDFAYHGVGFIQADGRKADGIVRHQFGRDAARTEQYGGTDQGVMTITQH